MSSGTRSTDSRSDALCDAHAAIDAVWRIESPRLSEHLDKGGQQH